MGGYSAGLGSPSGGSINPPGNTPAIDTSYTVYDTVAAVAAGVETTILTFVVPATVTHLVRVDFGGDNIGTYKMYWGTDEMDQYITYWTEFNGRWEYSISGGVGVQIPSGAVVTIKVLHVRPNPGDFYAKLTLVGLT